MTTALHRSVVVLLTNLSGGNVLLGDVVVVGSATASSFVTTTTAGLVTDIIGVALENILANAQGMICISGYVPQINLASSASLGDTFSTHTVAKQATPHSSKQVGDFGQVLGTGTTPEAILLYSAISQSQSTAIIQDQKSAGTDGGTFSNGAWQTRDLNTEQYDPDGIVSISANQFTLAAGTYKIYATAPGQAVTYHQARLYNITDAATQLSGSSEYAASASGSSRSIVHGVFTIAGSKVFEIQHRCATSVAGDGFGASQGTYGEVEIYTDIEITKIA